MSSVISQNSPIDSEYQSTISTNAPNEKDEKTNENRFNGKNILNKLNIQPIGLIAKNKKEKTKGIQTVKIKENIDLILNILLPSFEFSVDDIKKNSLTKQRIKKQNKHSNIEEEEKKNEGIYIFPCDDNVKNNPQYEYTYLNEITYELFNNVKINKPEFGKFSMVQRELTEYMKRKLFDWIINVNEGFSLRNETLYLCFNLIERYLSIKSVNKRKIKILGMSCLFIASKYEEIYPPKIYRFARVSNYSQYEILKMEIKVLETLNFDIYCIYSYHILQRLHFISQMPKEVFYISEFLLESTFFDDKYLKIDDFSKALAALFFGKVMKKEKKQFPLYLQEMINERKKEIYMFCKGIIGTIRNNISDGLLSLERKYANKYKISKKYTIM